MTPTIRHYGRGKTVERVKRLVVSRGGAVGRSERLLRALKLSCMVLLMMNTHHCTFVQTMECATPTVNP